MPTPDAVFVFIKISYKICYNRFRVIRVQLCVSLEQIRLQALREINLRANILSARKSCYTKEAINRGI